MHLISIFPAISLEVAGIFCTFANDLVMLGCFTQA